MKKICTLFAVAAALAGCSQPQNPTPGSSLNLDSGWQLSRDGSSEQYAASVPSTVAGVLCDAGFFPKDVLEHCNYAAVDKSIFDDAWTYRTSFAASHNDAQHYELAFEGLGYRADIIFNGKQLAASDTTFGVFRRHTYDVSELLTANNTLEVRLHRAQKGDLNIGFVDWNPRPLDESMGIVRPVTLRTYGAVSVEDVFVVPNLNTETLAEADLEVRVRLRNHENSIVDGTLALELQGVGKCNIPIKLTNYQEHTFTITPEQMPMLHVDKPRVWWSYDLGKPEMYNLCANVNIDGKLSDTRSVDFGIRKIESRLIEGNHRQFTLNGKDILIKGAGWTDDIFLRDTPESIERQVRYVMDMNLNCIRFENIWGKDDTIYDLCDRLGVLALVGWSCQWEWEDYCGLPEVDGYGCINTPETEDLAVAYFRDQVVRLHNHPAVIAWLTGSDRIPNERLEKRYLDIYAAEEYRPYVCSAKNLESAAGWSGTKMEGPYEYVGPDYWFRDKEHGGAFGFNTETGIGANMPQMESLRRMLDLDKPEEWNYHCTASASALNTTAVLTEVINGQYGEAKDVQDFVRKAHAVDYDGTRAMFEAFRVRMPAATGIVQWMLNSAWPSLYWQLYDYYGVPTAGYYGTKKACEPLQLIFDYDTRMVNAVNETLDTRTLKAILQVFDDHSKPIGGESREFSIAYRESLPLFDMHKYVGKAHFVALALETLDSKRVSDNFYCIPAHDNEYDWSNSNWYITPITKYADLRFAFNQEPADVTMTIERSNDVWNITLQNKSMVISYMNILKALNSAGEMVVPAIWSDNFVTLLPDETKVITCRTNARDVRFILDN